MDNGDAILQPILGELDVIPQETLRDYQSCLGNNPTGASVTTIVTKDIPLNKKQQMIVERILSEALAWVDYPYDSSKRRQTLLYIGGEGGVGKS